MREQGDSMTKNLPEGWKTCLGAYLPQQRRPVQIHMAVD